jgi:hypothetical protein
MSVGRRRDLVYARRTGRAYGGVTVAAATRLPVGCVDMCTGRSGGHREVLKWLREHHCPWDAHTVEQATAAGRADVLQWALDNGCPS